MPSKVVKFGPALLVSDLHTGLLECVFTDKGGPPDVHLEDSRVTTSIFAMPWAFPKGETSTNTFL